MQAAIRDALVAAVKVAYATAYPTVPIVYPNAPFDRNNLPAVWVEYEVKFSGGDQIGMAAAPKTRTHGFLYVTVWAREGTGTTTSLLMLDWFAAQLKYVSASGVQVLVPQPESPSSRPGWHLEQLKFYFYADGP